MRGWTDSHVSSVRDDLTNMLYSASFSESGFHSWSPHSFLVYAIFSHLNNALLPLQICTSTPDFKMKPGTELTNSCQDRNFQEQGLLLSDHSTENFQALAAYARMLEQQLQKPYSDFGTAGSRARMRTGASLCAPMALQWLQPLCRHLCCLKLLQLQTQS